MRIHPRLHYVLFFLLALVLCSSVLVAWVYAREAHAGSPAKCCIHHLTYSGAPTATSTPPHSGVVFASPTDTWEYSGGFSRTGYSMFVTSDGRGFSGVTPDPYTTQVPTTVPIEVLIADTNGQSFSAACSTPHYTGDPATDLACYINAAQAQGYPYVIGAEP